MLSRCVASIPAIDYELIVLSDDGSDGFTKKVNNGLSMARGGYLMVVNNDIEWMSGEIKDLCVPGTVTSPVIVDEHGERRLQNFWGCFFVVPRAVYETVGSLDEQFFLYCSDTDYVMRLREARVPMACVKSCEVFTIGGQTTKSLADREAIDAIDQALFVKKWGISPFQAIS